MIPTKAGPALMRASLRLAPAALLLAGCVAAPYPYAPPPYQAAPYPPPPYQAPPADPPPDQPGPPPGQPYVGPGGLTIVDGYPVTLYEGSPVPWVFLPDLGGWGYYDRLHRWHGAPPDISRRLERAHPGGRGLGPPPGRFNGGPAPAALRPGPGRGPGPATDAAARGRPPGPANPPPRREPEPRRNCPPNAQSCAR